MAHPSTRAGSAERGSAIRLRSRSERDAPAYARGAAHRLLRATGRVGSDGSHRAHPNAADVIAQASLLCVRGGTLHPRCCRNHGCTRCLDACPAGAVTSAGEKVRFDPFLCQGCGTCTAVCPDGAVRYAHPAAAAMRRPSSVLPSRAACSAACASRGAPNMRFNGSRASLFPH
jgi:ferredoxin